MLITGFNKKEMQKSAPKPFQLQVKGEKCKQHNLNVRVSLLLKNYKQFVVSTRLFRLKKNMHCNGHIFTLQFFFVDCRWGFPTINIAINQFTLVFMECNQFELQISFSLELYETFKRETTRRQKCTTFVQLRNRSSLSNLQFVLFFLFKKMRASDKIHLRYLSSGSDSVIKRDLKKP